MTTEIDIVKVDQWTDYVETRIINARSSMTVPEFALLLTRLTDFIESLQRIIDRSK